MSAPWRLNLPKTLEVCGEDRAIRTDYRVILDICAALSDPELTDEDKAFVALSVLYTDFDEIPMEHYREALEKCFWFINGGKEEPPSQSPKLVDWEQDFNMIVAPINRVVGSDVRGAEYMHWWTFLSAYYEIGDCTFAQVVRIREHLARGKKLEKQDREWYNKNRHLVDLKTHYTEEETALLDKWIRK